MESLMVSKLKMWARFATVNVKRDKQLNDCKRSISVNEEYQGALRSKSFEDFFTKAKLVIHDPLPSRSPSYSHHRVLLEPNQETIASILESKTIFKNSNLKGLILNYFQISSDASKICIRLLKRIIEIQSNYEPLQRVLNMDIEHYPSQCDVTDSKLYNLVTQKNPLSYISKNDFEVIRNKYSSALQKMKIKRRKEARKMKLISCFNKASRICVTAACSLVAFVAMALAAHTRTAIVMGPVFFSIPLKPLKRKLPNLQFLKSRLLRRVGDQLDVAMKGTYILNRDFDTMSRLVNRLHDDIERNRKMVELCLEGGRGEDKICLQVLRELKKSDALFRKQVEELEEHVYLCLLMINKARALLIKELTKSCDENF